MEKKIFGYRLIESEKILKGICSNDFDVRMDYPSKEMEGFAKRNPYIWAIANSKLFWDPEDRLWRYFSRGTYKEGDSVKSLTVCFAEDIPDIDEDVLREYVRIKLGKYCETEAADKGRDGFFIDSIYFNIDSIICCIDGRVSIRHDDPAYSIKIRLVTDSYLIEDRFRDDIRSGKIWNADSLPDEVRSELASRMCLMLLGSASSATWTEKGFNELSEKCLENIMNSLTDEQKVVVGLSGEIELPDYHLCEELVKAEYRDHYWDICEEGSKKEGDFNDV